MRIIVSFNGGGLTINFEYVDKIVNYGDTITLVGTNMTISVNATDICSVEVLRIQKHWLLSADEVYFDTRIEKEN
jgi:hypothetical protein